MASPSWKIKFAADAAALEGVPVTIPCALKPGEYFPGKFRLGGSSQIQQVNVRSLWDDGSICTATVSMQILSSPDVAVVLQPEAEAPVENAKFKYVIGDYEHMVLVFASGADQRVSLPYSQLYACADNGVGWTATKGNMERSGRTRLVAGPLQCIVEVTGFHRWPGMRFRFAVENCNVENPTPAHPDGTAVVTVGPKSKMYNGKHWFQTRWCEEIWYGETPPSYRIIPPWRYYSEIGIVPPMNEAVPVPASIPAETLKKLYTSGDMKAGNPWGVPLSNGVVYKQMPSTGDRKDIGWIPRWGRWFINGGMSDPAVELQSCADLNGCGAFPWHMRDSDGELGLQHGHKFWQDFPLVKKIGGVRSPYEPDYGHQPLLGFLTYLVTGNTFAAENFVSATMYGMRSQYPNTGNPDSEDRYAGWPIRNMALFRFLPDAHPRKAYVRQNVIEQQALWQWESENEWNQTGWGFGHGGHGGGGRSYMPYNTYDSLWQTFWFVSMGLMLKLWVDHPAYELPFRKLWPRIKQVIRTDKWIAPNGDVVPWNADQLVTYSPVVGENEPYIDSHGVVDYKNWRQIEGPEACGGQWLAEVTKQSGHVDTSKLGPEPWTPKRAWLKFPKGSYKDVCDNDYWEYGPGRVDFSWFARKLTDLPDLEAACAWLDARIIKDATARGYHQGEMFLGST